jgi:phytoene dehydrogenase-like protein
MNQGFDAIVVGGGHNGLTCGAYLARAGLRTLVLERRHVIGGAAVTEEIVPGFRFSVFSYLMSWLHPKVIRELELRRHGFEVLPASDMYGPLENGDGIVFADDIKRTQASFARFSRRDAEIYPEFDRYLGEAVRVIRKLILDTPVDPTRRSWRDFRESAAFLWKYRRIGKTMHRLIDLLTLSADDFLSHWFERTEIRAVLAYYSGIGTFAGPKTPGSAYVTAHHLLGEHAGAGGWGFIRGGMGTISGAIAASGRAHGMVVRTEAEVVAIDSDGDRVTGVTLADGSRIAAPVVASNASCKVTFLKLIDPAKLPADFVAAIRRYRTFSTAFKINIACERLPQYRGFDPAAAGFAYPTYCHVGPTIEYLEAAYEDAKHGRWSARPFMTPVAPSFVDDTIAPPGKHVLHLFGGHAPHRLAEGDWDEAEKQRFARNALATLDSFAPGFSDGIIDMQVLTPPDIERIINSPDGHIFHGEILADQLFLKRPAPHYADYRAPLRGLYQCGSSAHPGGGVSGLPGHNAAREILRDLRRRPH